MSTLSITPYERDVFAWANEQAALIRARRFDLLDIENIAEEILDVGKSEQREIASRMAVLLAHLLKWKFQPQFQGKSWRATIKTQRQAIADHLDDVPSLRQKLRDEKWVHGAYRDARLSASKETKIDFDDFPETCPWGMEAILQEGWLPE